MTMNHTKFYVQPLGLLRGFCATNGTFKCIAGGNIYFSAVKIIERSSDHISEDFVYVDALDDYLSHQSQEKINSIRSTLENISGPRAALHFQNGLELNWQKPVIQGVLNITPDSFSDGGKFEDLTNSLSQAEMMIGAGAGIIDVGGESTRPGASPISIETEKSRVKPVIKELSKKNCVISVDTRNAAVMTAAIDAGASIVNDVSALNHDSESINAVKRSHVPVILMHTKGTPEDMQDNPEYINVVLEIYDYLKSRIELCVTAGISIDKIIIDPGIGFGKTVEHNLQIVRNLALFHGLGVPILIGVSRKNFIGRITEEKTPSKRVYGSIAAAQICLDQGVQIIRVHDVEETTQALSLWNAAGTVK